MTDAKKPPENERNPKQPESIFGIIGKDIKDWWGKLRETLNYKVDADKICHYFAPKKSDTDKSEENKTDKSEENKTDKSEENKTDKSKEKIEFGNNFSCYIGKTGEKGSGKGENSKTWKIWSKKKGNNNEENNNTENKQESEQTIYSDEMLKILIEYIINHTREGEHSTIQIWSDVGILFQQGSEKGISSPQNQLKDLKRLIEKEFGKRGKCINVVIGSEQEQCKKFFNKLRQKKEGERRFGLIPEKEPNLKKYLSKTPKEKLSPVPIIKYLAYHANKDPELMKLFYNTKPPLYRTMDGENYIPGTSDADYYGIVEVGLRLTDVLKGISIQGGARRQRAYDKIISLILYGEDVISKKGEFEYYLQFASSLKSEEGSKKSKESTETTESKKSKKTKESIKPIKSEALFNLYRIIQDIKSSNKNGINTDFGQVYADVNRAGIEKIKKRIEDSEKLKNKFNYGALIALTLLLGGFAYNSYENKQEKERKDKEKTEAYKSYPNTYPFSIELPEDMSDGTKKKNIMDSMSYMNRQSELLVTAYDLSKFEYIDGNGFKHNKIVDEYDKAYRLFYSLTGKDLSALDFMRGGIPILVEHGIKYQEPYALLRKHQQNIDNTLKYGDTIDISKYKIEEINPEEKFEYYNEKTNRHYSLKRFRVYRDSYNYIEMFFATNNKDTNNYTPKYGLWCIEDLCKYYGK